MSRACQATEPTGRKGVWRGPRSGRPGHAIIAHRSSPWWKPRAPVPPTHYAGGGGGPSDAAPVGLARGRHSTLTAQPRSSRSPVHFAPVGDLPLPHRGADERQPGKRVGDAHLLAGGAGGEAGAPAQPVGAGGEAARSPAPLLVELADENEQGAGSVCAVGGRTGRTEDEIEAGAGVVSMCMPYDNPLFSSRLYGSQAAVPGPLDAFRPSGGRTALRGPDEAVRGARYVPVGGSWPPRPRADILAPLHLLTPPWIRGSIFDVARGSVFTVA